MSVIAARYYDGKSSRSYPISIDTTSPCELHILGDTLDVVYAVQAVRVSDRLGNTPRHLYFPDGAQCEIADNDAIDALFALHPSVALNHYLHRGESHLHYALAACALTVIITWATISYGIPALAKQVAFRLPIATDQLIGKQALAELDQHFLQPSLLTAQRQTQLNALFAQLQRDIPNSYQLALRDSKSIGANALALPSGVIVMTDPLVKLAQNDDEIIAVLAHEIGHLQQRHAMRQILQNSATALVVMTLTGDIGSVTSLAAGLPTLLVQSKFSRDFEREADDFAFNYLKQQHRPTAALTGILLRMEKRDDEPNRIFKLFSTHPAAQERVKPSP